MVNEQCELELQIGSYMDKILCDVMHMDVCHIFLERPWQFDRTVVHDGKRNLQIPKGWHQPYLVAITRGRNF